MEQHPVPQNIIEVEFKLFGSFTLVQFGKMLAGGLIALLIFTLNIPAIIKFPLCFISVILGIGLAIVPNLGTWLNGFFKAIFFSPRYVWMKEPETPELLKQKQAQKASDPNQKISGTKVKKKVDIEDVSMEELFGPTTKAEMGKDAEDQTPRNSNFLRVYEDVFGEKLFERDKNSPINKLTVQGQTKASSTAQQVIIPAQSSIRANKAKSMDEYRAEIESLKYQLSMLSKDENYKAKEEEIISKINDLYQEIRVLSSDESTSKKTTTTTQPLGRIIFGIIVDKKDNPLPSVTINFLNKEKNMLYRVVSSKDGKFSTVKGIPYGNYVVSLDDHGKHKFHKYQLAIGEQNQPAFKFREK